MGRLSTCYSPVRRFTHPRRNFRARLACVRHAASVQSEPESNSPVIKNQSTSIQAFAWLLSPTRYLIVKELSLKKRLHSHRRKELFKSFQIQRQELFPLFRFHPRTHQRLFPKTQSRQLPDARGKIPFATKMSTPRHIIFYLFFNILILLDKIVGESIGCKWSPTPDIGNLKIWGYIKDFSDVMTYFNIMLSGHIT